MKKTAKKKSTIKFEDLYDEIISLHKADADLNDISVKDHLNKLFEEAGELAKEVNKLTGRKKCSKKELEKVSDNLLAEGADTIQCVLAILASQGIEFEEIKAALKKSNKGYQKYI